MIAVSHLSSMKNLTTSRMRLNVHHLEECMLVDTVGIKRDIQAIAVANATDD